MDWTCGQQAGAGFPGTGILAIAKATTGSGMPGKSGISASELARNYGVSLNEFADEVIKLLARVETDASAARVAARRREVCAAVSAAMSFALDASTLTPEERAQLEPLLREVLVPFWNRHCAAGESAADYIVERSAFYLARRVPGSQVKTAVSIVTSLVDALELPEARRAELVQALSPSFAHRVVADVYRLNDARARFGLQLTLVGAVGLLLQMSPGYDSLLRILRIN